MPGLLAPHNAFLPGVNRSLGTICKVKFAQYVADMTFDCANADDQFISDFLIGEASGDQRKYFDFPVSEFCKEGAPIRFPTAELFDQA